MERCARLTGLAAQCKSPDPEKQSEHDNEEQTQTNQPERMIRAHAIKGDAEHGDDTRQAKSAGHKSQI